MTLTELDFQKTRLGELVLRRRVSSSLAGQVVYEVILDGEFLMSSVVTDSEVALTNVGLAAVQGPVKRVMVGGLGLGHTAVTALDWPGLESLDVVEYLEPVLSWHRRGLVPLGARLTSDPRCHLVHDDFFAVVSRAPTRAYDAILIDIDHSPESLLSPANAAFYEQGGLQKLRAHLRPGGVLALWSADPMDEAFVARARAVFASARTEEIEFYNPFLSQDDTNTLLIATA
jgi:spermidine synthase